MILVIETTEDFIVFPAPKVGVENRLSCFPATILSITVFDSYEAAIHAIPGDIYREVSE